MDVVLYMRYSSERQTEQSIEGQDRVCREFCARMKYRIVDVYIDRALSASKNTEKRIAFQQMVEDSATGRFQGVIVYKLDRFARNRYDSAIYRSRLKKNGVKVISATENITDTPEGVILESVLEGLAEYYSMELSQKIKRGMNETALKGNYCGGTIPFGYAVDRGCKKFIIDAAKGPIAQEAFKRYANGEQLTALIDDFKKRGIKTSTGKDFNKNSFHRMFRNKQYIGIYHYGDVEIVDGVPRLISDDLFALVQKRVELNERAPGRSKAKVDYLLSQKLYCGHCDTLMVGECGTGKNGTRHYYYACAGRKRLHNCDKKPLRKEFIERVVVEDALRLLENGGAERIADLAYENAKKRMEENKAIPSIMAHIKDVNKKIANLVKMIERGSDSPAILDRITQLEDEKRGLQLQLEDERRNLLLFDKSQIVWWLSEFSQGDVNDESFRKKVIDMLVSSVTVWDEPDGFYKITVFYNLSSENQKTLRFSDVKEGSDIVSLGPPKKRSTPCGCFSFLRCRRRGESNGVGSE